MVGHIDTSGRMIIEGHNDLRGHFLVASKSSPAIYFTSEMQLKREVSEVRKAPGCWAFRAKPHPAELLEVLWEVLSKSSLKKSERVVNLGQQASGLGSMLDAQ